MGVSYLLDPAGFLRAGSFPFCATATPDLTIRAAPDLRFGIGSPWKAPARSGLVISVLFYPVPPRPPALRRSTTHEAPRAVIRHCHGCYSPLACRVTHRKCVSVPS